MTSMRPTFQLGQTDKQRRRALLSTISHSAMHTASPALYDIPLRAILRGLARALWGDDKTVIIAPGNVSVIVQDVDHKAIPELENDNGK